MTGYRIIKDGDIHFLYEVEYKDGKATKLHKKPAQFSGVYPEDIYTDIRQALTEARRHNILDTNLKPINVTKRAEIEGKALPEHCEICGKKVYLKGWCSYHYSNYTRTGDPLSDNGRYK